MVAAAVTVMVIRAGVTGVVVTIAIVGRAVMAGVAGAAVVISVVVVGVGGGVAGVVVVGKLDNFSSDNVAVVVASMVSVSVGSNVMGLVAMVPRGRGGDGEESDSKDHFLVYLKSAQAAPF